MVHTPHDDEDSTSEPFIEQSFSHTSFEHDPYWIEIPGGVWTPELEHKYMPIRDATPAELADTERKRGSSEDETCPIDPLLENLDFTSEYISPKEQSINYKEQLQRYYDHIKFLENTDELIYFDEDDEDW